MRALQLVAAIILGCSLIGCHHYVCDNELLSEHSSPDGRWKYVIFRRDCGATTRTNFQISVLPISVPLPNEPADAFTGDDNHGATPYIAEVMWIGPKAIQIDYSSKARIFRKEARVGPIEIRYVVDP
jgi:hypothetical protein